MPQESRITVYTVGPDLSVKGGPSRVFYKIKDRFPEHIAYRLLATHTAYIEGPAMRTRLSQALAFTRAAVLTTWFAADGKDAIFHVHFSERGSTIRKGLICCILRALGARYLLHEHAAEGVLFFDWLPGWARRAILWGFGGASRFIALNNYWKNFYQDALQLDPSRIMILPNAAELPSPLPDRSNNRYIEIVFLGRIGVRKGAFDIVRAFAALPGHIRQRCRLTLAGDGAVEEARGLVRQCGCEDLISVPGWLSASQVSELLKRGQILLLPSRAEGMSIALLEGLGWGLAVVTSGAGGSTEFLQHRTNCLLVQPGNVTEIADAMAELATDETLRNSIAQAGRRTVEPFGLDIYVRRLTALYEEMVGSSDRQTTAEAGAYLA